MSRGSGPDPGRGGPVATGTPRSEIDAFLEQARNVPAPASGTGGRLVFALDATMSRQPTWDLACSLQAEMFRAAAAAGGLQIQLVYFRGFGECRASRWIADAKALTGLMTSIDCRGGLTQIERVLRHVAGEAAGTNLKAFVFVGDAMEESLGDLRQAAGELGLLGIKGFVFQEGTDSAVEEAYREIARLTGGAYARFSAGSAATLAALLRSAASYAAGGREALAKLARSGDADADRLLTQLR